MKKLLKKLRTTAERWRTRCFEALGFVPSAELYAMREAYNDELRERLMLKRDYENLYEDYRKALETPARRYGYAITPASLGRRCESSKILCSWSLRRASISKRGSGSR